jgi:hypothetical protein
MNFPRTTHLAPASRSGTTCTYVSRETFHGDDALNVSRYRLGSKQPSIAGVSREPSGQGLTPSRDVSRETFGWSHDEQVGFESHRQPFDVARLIRS